MRSGGAWCAGSLLALSAGTAWAQLASTNIVDTGAVGQYTSVAFGVDGLPLISYYDVTNGDLKVAHCADVACASSTRNPIDTDGDVGLYTSIAIGNDGRGIISYVHAGTLLLKVAHCADAACSSATSVTLSSLGPVGPGTDIAIGTDGKPLIAFRAGNVLKIARCVDAVCSDATAVPYAGGGNNPTIAIAGNGLPLIAHDNGTRIFLGRCQDAACSTATFLTIFPPPPDPGEGAFLIRDYSDPFLAVGPDGRGVLAHVRHTTTPITNYYDVLLNRCADVACSSLLSAGGATFGSAPPSDPRVAIASDDVPFAAWTRFFNDIPFLEAVPCLSPSCAGALPNLYAGPGAGTFPSLALSPAGRALVVYHDEWLGRLMASYFGGDAASDLTVTAAASPDPVVPTQTLRYRIDAHNLGPDFSQTSVSSIALPPGTTFQTASPPGCTYEFSTHTVTCPPQPIPAGQKVFAGIVDVRVPPNLPGPLDATVSIAGANTDPDPSNNSITVSTATGLGLVVAAPSVIEGQSGVSDARIDVAVLDDGHGVPSPLEIFFGTGGGTASAGLDYVSVVGALTFAAAGTQTVTVGILGDLAIEPDETFFLNFSLPVNLTVASNPPTTIVDDDGAVPAAGELAHGTSFLTDFAGGGEDVYHVAVPPRASFEVLVDGLSGDAVPFALERMGPNGSVLQQAPTSGAGGSASLCWRNDLGVPLANQVVRVASTSCTTDCGPDDVYRLRAYETTARIPRFNNTATQSTVLVLQNPSDQPIAGTAYFWGADGTMAASLNLGLPPRATMVTNTASLVPGQSGSVTVNHTAPYGVLQGKAVAVEPATGFSFDSPLAYRPR